MARYRRYKSKDKEIVDKNTGELLDYYITKKLKIEEFIMVFFASYSEIMKLQGQKVKLLMLCWKFSSFGNSESGNILVNNAVFKDNVRKYEPNMTDSAIDAGISTLAKRGFLKRMCKGQYELNPDYFFKGTLSNRSHLKFSVEVDPASIAERKDKNGNLKSYCFLAKSISLYRDVNTKEDL